MLQRIEIHDERLQVFKDLKSTRAKSDHLVVEGRYCVKRLAASQLEPTAVLVKEGCEHEIASWFPTQTSIYVCSSEEIRSLVGFDFHRGVLAAALRPISQAIDVFSRRVVRVSMGTVFKQQIISTLDLSSDLATLNRTSGVRTIASMQDEGAVPLHQMALPQNWWVNFVSFSKIADGLLCR